MHKEDGLRTLERLLFHNPEISINNIPSLDDLTMACQEMEAFAHDYTMSSIYTYAYVRDYGEFSGKSSCFIDIYFYIIDRRNEIVRRRFVIVPGYQMSAEREKEFLYFVNAEYTSFNLRVCGDFVKKLNEIAPELHLEEYRDFGMVLAHVYFTSFKSGFRELIWKVSGLENIAMNLHLIENWNLLAKNVEEAFDVPIKMLRKLNSVSAVENILNMEEGRRNAKNVYNSFHSILNNFDQLNQFQVRYLVECNEAGIDIVDVDKRIVNLLGMLESGWDCEGDEYIDGNIIYNHFMEYKDLVGKAKECSRIFPKYPSLTLEDLQRFYKIFYFLKYYLAHEKVINERFGGLLRKWRRELCFEDEQYVIIPPGSIKDIFDESQNQCNCLYEYIERILAGKTTVVFMRKKDNPRKSLITIEICGNKIVQALMACNKTISNMSQLQFLKKYAAEKKLSLIDICN